MCSLFDLCVDHILQSVSYTSPHRRKIVLKGHEPIFKNCSVPIATAGAASVAALGLALADLHLQRERRVEVLSASNQTRFSAFEIADEDLQRITVDVRHSGLGMRAYAYMSIPDSAEQLKVWSDLGGFYECKNYRWIQLHTNFPHHLQGVLDFFGFPKENPPSRTDLAAKIKQWDAFKLEERLTKEGMCVAVVRQRDEWLKTEQGQAMKDCNLINIKPLCHRKPLNCKKEKGFELNLASQFQEPLRALRGVKMLDLSRVISGPVCGRSIAENGAQVLRVASPSLPYIKALLAETGFGKRNVFIDLKKNNPNYPKHHPENIASDYPKFLELVQEADIVLDAYRPSSLKSLGIDPETLIFGSQSPTQKEQQQIVKRGQRTKPMVYIQLNGYGDQGPWADRRAFDSLVQSACGMALLHPILLNPQSEDPNSSQNNIQPKHLPAQVLDYITGYLAAFAAVVCLQKIEERQFQMKQREEKRNDEKTNGSSDQKDEEDEEDDELCSYLVQVSLLQTAEWLWTYREPFAQELNENKKDTTGEVKEDLTQKEEVMDDGTKLTEEDRKKYLMITKSESFGTIEHLKPILHLSKTPPFYSFPPQDLGTSEPVWQ